MTEREQFEATFSAPPYEFRMERWGDRAAWAGNYKSYNTQCAWDGYQEARAALAPAVDVDEEVRGHFEVLDLENHQLRQQVKDLQRSAVQTPAAGSDVTFVPRADYAEAFFELAKLMDIASPQPVSPERVWREQMLPRLRAALAQPVAAEPEMWRHKKSGGVYEFLMSVVNEADQDIHVVYRSVETCVRWSRRSIEFYDGRFERLPPTPA